MVSVLARRWVLFMVFLLVTVMVAAGSRFPAASAETAPAPGGTVEAPFVPRQGIYFNNPMGTRDEQHAISDQLVRTIDVTPPGATIYLTAYSFTAEQDVAALVRAHRRGVFVKLLVDSHVVSAEMLLMRKMLGTDTRRNSYIRTCKYSCMSNRPSYLHSKVATFSTAGGVNFVTMISSANPANTGVLEAWNNMYLVVGDRAIYDANVRYFHDMLADRSRPNYFRSVSSGNLKQYFTPRAKGDTMLSVLKRVSCTGAAPGFGTNGRTRIRVAMFAWTSLRTNIARRLNTLKAQGCDIQIAYTADRVHRPVTKALLKRTKKGRIKVFNGRLDRDGDGIYETYIHHKYVSINGVYKGRPDATVVYTGSTNFTLNTVRSNNEVMLMVNDPQVLHQVEMNFRLIREKWSEPVKSATAARRLTLKLANVRVVDEDGRVVRAGSRPARAQDELG